jgi:hypothetical protein
MPREISHWTPQEMRKESITLWASRSWAIMHTGRSSERSRKLKSGVVVLDDEATGGPVELSCVSLDSVGIEDGDGVVDDAMGVACAGVFFEAVVGVNNVVLG